MSRPPRRSSSDDAVDEGEIVELVPPGQGGGGGGEGTVSRAERAAALASVQVMSQSGYNSFVRSLVITVLVFVALIAFNSSLQRNGLLPSVVVGAPHSSSTDSLLASSLPSSTTLTSSAPASAAGDDGATAAPPTATDAPSPSAAAQQQKSAADARFAPSLVGNWGYAKQSTAIFRDVMRVTPGYDSAALMTPAAGVYTEATVAQGGGSGGRPLRESELFATCWNRFSELSVVAPPDSISAADPPLLLQLDASPSSRPFYRYDVVLLPVGCFGDAISRRDLRSGRCRTTSCAVIAQLAKFVSCGVRPVGMILGDNFYPRGIERRDGGRLAREFGAKFLSQPSLRDVPFFGTVGNHDEHPSRQYRSAGPRRAPLRNSSSSNNAAAPDDDVLATWIMPAAHHVTPVIVAGDDDDKQQQQQQQQQRRRRRFTVQLFFVSTQWGFGRNAPHMAEEARWLDEQLGKSTADIKIVSSHEPIFSFLNFDHSASLVEHIHPLLVKHGVPLFIAAHAHSVHFHRCRGGYYQLVSAGFADNLHPGVRFKRPKGHFYIGRGASAVAINATHIVTTAFDLKGQHVFHHAVEWAQTIREVRAWGAGDKRVIAALERNEIGPAELWAVADPVCKKGSLRAAAPWCPLATNASGAATVPEGVDS